MANADVLAAIAQDDTQQTKYDVTVRNDTSSALSGFSARVYFDVSEFGDASLVRCDERYDPSGAGTCTLVAFNGNIHYADLRFGSLSLAAGASVGFKITLRLSDWSNRWNGANDFSRGGLTGSPAVTTLIPLYRGTTRLSGSDPGSTPPANAPLPVTAVSASADDGNVPANTLDGNLSTRWSASGDGQWISYDLGSARLVKSVDVAWYNGNSRIAFFDVQTSNDGSNFVTRHSGQSSGTSSAFESYDIADVVARHVRILGHGNSVNAWNSIAETRIFGSNDTGTVDTQAPTVPGNLQAEAASSSRVDLSWNASSDNVGVTGYRVYRGGTLVGSPAGISFSDTGLAASTSYSYSVRAVDGAGNVSDPSSSVTVQTLPSSGGCSGALNTAAAIQNAMLNANAGTVISIAPGTYTGNRATSGDPRTVGGLPVGVFYSGRSGTASNRIVLQGCDAANPPVLRGVADDDGSYGIHLTGDYWELRNLEIETAQKGIMLDNANRNLITGVTVHDVGDEAVHFRDGSSYNTIEHSRIYATGKYQAQYGEGVYVGSDGGTSTYEHTVVDNVIRHVDFMAGITAEHIDVKEGATGTLIEYNDFDGTGISGQNSADSFVDIKGVNSIVRFNTGRRNGNSNVVDAFQVRTHSDCCATGTNNRFNDNSVHLDGIGSTNSSNGYVVYATSQATGTTSTNDRRTDGNGNIHNRNVNR